MFNIDLLNSTGLQKVIARSNVNNSTEKQKISFNSNNVLISKDSNKSSNIVNKNQHLQEENSSSLSYFIFGLLLFLITF